MNKKRLIIIDGHSLIHRAFYAIPELTTKDGVHTNAIYGFFNMYFKMLEDYQPDYISIAFDMKGPTFRHEEYEDYKAHRPSMPDELSQQMPIIKEILDRLNVHRMELQGFEADDLLGTVSSICAKEGLDVFIISGDKDILQLVDENIHVLYTKRGISNLKQYEIKDVEKEFGVKPKYVPDYKGLCGDKSDNIPGIDGIGDKTAQKLLKQFNTVEEIVQNVETIKSTRARNRLEGNEAQALLSKKLATIQKNVPLEFNLDELKFQDPEVEDVIDVLKTYELNSILKRIKNLTGFTFEEAKINYEIIKENFGQVIEQLNNADEVAFKIIYDHENVVKNKALGIAFSLKGNENYYIDLKNNHDKIVEFKDFFENDSIQKIGYEAKEDYLILFNYDIQLKGLIFDGFIANYLLDPATSNYDLSKTVMEVLTKSMVSEEDLLGTGSKKKKFQSIALEALADYAVNYSYFTFKVKETLEKEIKDMGLKELLEDIEIPLIESLANVEYVGFNVDQEELKALDEILSGKLEEITAEVYDLAEKEFNINSPQQLSEVLFEDLELPVIKKTKTGYSTSHDVLEKLEGKHPIIPLIMEYRTYQKLKSTYIDGLYAVINEATGRIHTSLNQTVTATGRLSSTEPNLQNIPVRIPIGRRIRKVFVPSKGNILLGADYSQIELRVLAHMSEDENLLKAYTEGIDVHTLTASQVFNKDLDEVTTLDRSRAKEVNFGIVYGMSDYGLSENLGISRNEAKKYIEKYFKKYSGVKTFMNKILKDCKENGYVETLLKRRRYIREINDSNYYKRQYAERMAQNTPIQGSAADIIKIAMVRTYKRLKEENLQSKLILQVHDELILDVVPEELEQVKGLLKESMENAYQLKVPLKVDMNEGESWYDTK